MLPIFSIGIIVQCVSIWVILKIIKSKEIRTIDRWFWSMFIFICPIIGLFFYQVFQGTLRAKEYKSFSDSFINRHLS